MSDGSEVRPLGGKRGHEIWINSLSLIGPEFEPKE